MSTDTVDRIPLRLVRAMARMTIIEADAIDRYRAGVSSMFWALRKRHTTTGQTAQQWHRALEHLGTYASGSPQFDRYLQLQSATFTGWLDAVALKHPAPTGNPTEGKINA